MIRKLSSFVFAVVAIVSIVTSASQAQSFMTRHVREVTVNGQSQSVGRLPATQSMRFDVVLPLRHQPELQNFLQEIYDPSSPSYRHFVTPQEFTARFGPSQDDYDAVLAFAKASGFAVVGGSRDSRDIQLKGTVAAIEKAFHVTMGVYQHPTENRTFYSPDREPTVNLPFPLWHVSGLDNYSIARPASLHKNLKAKPQTVQGSCPGGFYCGSDMRAAYYGQTTLTGSGQTLGLLEYVGYDIADLQTYYNNTGQTDNVPVIGISTDGTAVSCTYPSCDDTEQILDMTQTISMAPAMSGLYVYVGSTDTAMLSSMATNTPLNAQLSCSWAWQPADPSTDDPYYQQFAAQGQSFFTASGDAGSYPNGTPYYYPAEDANVTAVGGTDLVTQGAAGPWSSETAWSLSGGGISQDGIPIPSYQQLAGVINSSNGGSDTLRNIPDVSGEANFDFYVCYNQSGCAGGWG
ncbi:MAG: protease pro-enzyme activation domain-containing protein, partial [Terriglobales bacterium]